MEIKNDVSIIKTSRLASNAAILNKDVAGVSKFWLSDFVQVAGDGSHTIGKSRIVSDWKEMFASSNPIFKRLPEHIVIAESGLIAWEQGEWDYPVEGYFGNYSAMWRKVKGVWLTQCELYVSLH